MKIFISGGAGFIGSNLSDRLLKEGHGVTVFDNLSTGSIRFLEQARDFEKFSLIEGDLLDENLLSRALKDHEMVFHLAANADVRFGINHPKRDLEQNTIATFNILECMRQNGIKQIAFASTGSVYGETEVIPTPENAPFPIQTSLYASSKLAGEALISSYCEAFDFQSWIFRFVSILGERYTHGHVFDFYKKIKKDPKKLEVLGNGKQRKSYLYVQDCLDAIICALDKSNNNVNIFNLGVDTYCEVNDSIKWICNDLDVSPMLEYSGGDRGWIGDNPFIFLDTQKIKSLGWEPKFSIQEGVQKTIQFLKLNEWVFDTRV